MTMATCYAEYDLTPGQPSQRAPPPVQHKDYSRPLHVDCSVEYELPSQAKPPPSGRNEPLLMIHPCYFRKMESQRRSPFINNLPGRGTSTSRRTSSRTLSQSSVAVALQHQQRNAVVQQQSVARQQQQQQSQAAVHIQIQQQPVPAIQYASSTVPQYQIATTRQLAPPNQQQQQWGEPPLQRQYSKPAVAVGKHCSDSLALSGCTAGLYTSDGGLWTDTNHSPLAGERFPEPVVHPEKHILTGKYRQYLRTHRLHPYMSMAASAFPQLAQMQQISCYNV